MLQEGANIGRREEEEDTPKILKINGPKSCDFGPFLGFFAKKFQFSTVSLSAGATARNSGAYMHCMVTGPERKVPGLVM